MGQAKPSSLSSNKLINLIYYIMPLLLAAFFILNYPKVMPASMIYLSSRMSKNSCLTNDICQKGK